MFKDLFDIICLAIKDSGHWRRQPRIYRDVLNVDSPQVRALIDEISTCSAQEGFTDGRWFRQNVKVGEIDAASVKDALKSEYGSPLVWLDGVVLESGKSIGSHFDDSDNFVVQLSGTKRWEVSSPKHFPSDLLRLRMTNATGVGSCSIGPDKSDYILSPGDVLYLPLFWAHCGVSVDDSMSLSIVIHSESLANAEPQFRNTKEAWRPIAISDCGGPFDVAVPTTSDSRRIPAIKDSWAARFAITPEYLRLPDFTDRPEHDEFPEIMNHFSEEYPLAPIEDLVVPGEHASCNSLRCLLGRVYLRRLLMVLFRISAENVIGSVGDQVRVILHIFERLSTECMVSFAIQPEVTAIVTRLEEALAYSMTQLVETCLLHLGRCTLGPLLSEAPLITEHFCIAESSPQRALLVSIGKVIDLPPAHGKVWKVSYRDGALTFSSSNKTITIDSCKNVSAEHSRLSCMDRVPETPVFLMDRNDWISKFAIDDRMQGVSDWPKLDQDEFSGFCGIMSAAYSLVLEWWPETAAEFTEDIHVLSPLLPEGLHPHNETLPICRGMIRMAPRPAYRVAQAFAHELAHNRLNSILDIYAVFNRKARNLDLYSPFRETTRPITAVLHGAMAFLNDCEMSVRIEGNVCEVGSTSVASHAAWCVDRVKKAIVLLRETDVWTEFGEALLATIEQRIDKLA